MDSIISLINSSCDKKHTTLDFCLTDQFSKVTTGYACLLKSLLENLRELLEQYFTSQTELRELAHAEFRTESGKLHRICKFGEICTEFVNFTFLLLALCVFYTIPPTLLMTVSILFPTGKAT